MDTAWYITSQSSFAEQTGMLAAAMLMIEAPDLATQLCYSTAVLDEAIHIEAFSRSAIRLKGTVKPPDNHFREQRSIALNPESSYLTRLTIHTLLEGWATDEFAIFADAFKNDLLGEIYTRVYSDESRHVRIGLSCIRKLLAESRLAEDFSLEEAEALADQAAQLTDQTYAGLARMSGRTPEEIRRWFDERHKSRMDQIVFN
jgi:1,2-phenylacetyl-CoA epoxidase catalytic subunit